MGFSRQEYWCGLPFPPPGDIPDPGIKPASPEPPALAVGFSLVAQTVKNWSAMRETWVPSLAWEYPLEEEMATHPSILAWEISCTEEPVWLQSMGSQESYMT